VGWENKMWVRYLVHIHKRQLSLGKEFQEKQYNKIVGIFSLLFILNMNYLLLKFILKRSNSEPP